MGSLETEREGKAGVAAEPDAAALSLGDYTLVQGIEKARVAGAGKAFSRDAQRSSQVSASLFVAAQRETGRAFFNARPV
jgi:hypothetical protein